MQPLHVTMQPLNNAEILIPCTRWITIQHLNNARIFYAPEGTSGGILKSLRPSVHPSVTNRVSAISHKLLKQI